MSGYELFEEAIEEAGIYCWCLDNDTLYGDSAIARLFGLNPASTVKGLPVTDYFARIKGEDRQMVAGLVARAIEDGQPYRAEYRVMGDNGKARWVMALGRCFRDDSGNPVSYAGIIYPVERH